MGQAEDQHTCTLAAAFQELWVVLAVAAARGNDQGATNLVAEFVEGGKGPFHVIAFQIDGEGTGQVAGAGWCECPQDVAMLMQAIAG